MNLLTAPAISSGLSPLTYRVDSARDYDDLIDAAGESQVVLIGEASHGTHEFYATRALLTRRLIAEKGFRVVTLEADWPDTLRVHRYIHGDPSDGSAAAALGDFRHFPAWMWRNAVMVQFVEWLREWNASRRDTSCALFGLDLYSMHASMDAVLAFLEKTDPAAARRARDRYGCFDSFGSDAQLYGHAVTGEGAESCEEEVVAQLVEMRRVYGNLIAGESHHAGDEFFYAEQNARLIANAGHYYRSMFRGRDQSWNLRDAHMVETLEEILRHHGGRVGRGVVVWAHNSHLGDARATSMSERDEWNVGQLLREKHGPQVFSIGFSTYHGTVTAARDWGAPAERRMVRPALPGSYEELFHETEIPAFWIDLRRHSRAEILKTERLQRAIGVIYHPETERWSHYYQACLPGQFDALIHLDRTRALEPLERTGEWDDGEIAETYPSGL